MKLSLGEQFVQWSKTFICNLMLYSAHYTATALLTGTHLWNTILSRSLCACKKHVWNDI